MLQELKMKSLKGHAASIIIALALAAGLLWGTGFGAFKAIGGPKPLDSLDVSELKGQYVEAEVYLIYDWYAYTERTNTSTNRSTVTEKEYIIPVGDAEYMGLAVDAGYISAADDVPFPVSWTVKMKKKQKETQDILSYHTQAAGCSDKARAKASGGRQPIEECGRTGL